ncbi:MAG: aminotransferase class V-fold PLP-dependent enzyme [Gammaproteobacteria bacterium]|nr:aminotransferase class V-fold PLP-dependent enzyme [Gammaproteobacteria bacterium]
MPGQHFLFVPGPTNVPHQVLSTIHVPMEDHRSPSLPELTIPLFQDLKKIFQTETGQVFVFPASGTGGWEAALENTLSSGDRVLTSSFGQFSYLWVDMCKRLGFDVVNCDVDWGEGVPVERYREILADDTKQEIKAVLMCHNETATGVTSDIPAVRKVLDELGHPAMLYADGVSSIASIDFRMDEWKVDLAVSGSQKGFMLPAGLAIVCASQKALAARERAGSTRCFFDFQDQINTNQNGYFPYTPSVPMLRGLRTAVDMLLTEGLNNIFARHYRLAEGVRRAVKQGWGLKLCAKEPKWESDTVSAIMTPQGFDAAKVIRVAYDKYHLSLGAGLSKVAGKVFRIGHLGDLNELMLCAAICGAEMSMRDIGIEVEPGSGIAAATEYWRTTAVEYNEVFESLSPDTQVAAA